MPALQGALNSPYDLGRMLWHCFCAPDSQPIATLAVARTAWRLDVTLPSPRCCLAMQAEQIKQSLEEYSAYDVWQTELGADGMPSVIFGAADNMDR